MCVLFNTPLLWGKRWSGALTVWSYRLRLAVIAPIYRPESARNRYVIGTFGSLLSCRVAFYEFAVDKRIFVEWHNQLSF